MTAGRIRRHTVQL